MSTIIGTPEFIKNLDGWLFKNEQVYAEWLRKNKAGIPSVFRTSSNFLYRGMLVDEDFLEKKTITLTKNTSWSRSEKMAKAFVNDPAFRIGKLSGIPIIVRKRVPSSSIIIDVFGFVMFMGEKQLEMLGMDSSSIDSAVKEQEVLIERGVKIVKSDVIRL